MKAVSLDLSSKEDRSRLCEVDLPIPPLRSGEIRVKTKAVSFNPIDVQIRRSRLGDKPLWSAILGRDLAGVVEAVAPDVTAFRPGDEVFSNVCNRSSSGTYAEFVNIPHELAARKPSSLNWQEAAAVPVAGITAMLALERAAASASTSLFVAGGAGGVGSFAIVLAQRMGLKRLVVTARREGSRRHLIQALRVSPDQILDPNESQFFEKAVTTNKGLFDVTLDLVGGRMLSTCCRLVAVDGRVVSATELPSLDDGEFLFDRNASFCAIGAHAHSLSEDRHAWATYRARLEGLARCFDGGELPPPCVTVAGSFSVETVETAHAMLEQGAIQGKLTMVF